MSEITKILAILSALEIPVHGEIVKDAETREHFFIYVLIKKDKDNKQIPSNRTLEKARSILASQQLNVEFLLTDSQAQDIEIGLRAALLHTFSNEIRNVFLSVREKTAYIWLDTNSAINNEQIQAIQTKALRFLEEFNLALAGVTFTSIHENLPGKLVLLRVIRNIAPAKLEEIKSELIRRDFSVPSDDWLNKRLDALRKSGNIIRISDGKYALSLSTLHNLGTVKKGKRSPDVSRLLALARK